MRRGPLASESAGRGAVCTETRVRHLMGPVAAEGRVLYMDEVVSCDLNCVKAGLLRPGGLHSQM
jgi:hypothetical protein